ncbi:MAG: type II toxin-antitoxin system VapC family toxin [Candidatus Njordarchaeia archaeon]
MGRIVTDASVIIKWFIEENYTEKALEIRDRYINGEIVIDMPALMPFEVLNALRYSNLFNKRELRSIAEALTAYGFEYHSLKGGLATLTVDLAIENNITIYDASYLVLALKLNAILYTTDEKLIRSTEQKYGKNIKHLKEF